MQIKRIQARNFKTYLDLDLDLSVTPGKPIVLIGGANGGGKTTLFQAIEGALYGLKILSAEDFTELLNDGKRGEMERGEMARKIELTIRFTGQVQNEEQEYVLSRTYILNPEGRPVEGVTLVMGGDVFKYGTATPAKQRQDSEETVNKIIKANLPHELSRYFLFDALETGKLLDRAQLNRVIRENVENVMGFDKYGRLSQASRRLYDAAMAHRQKSERERQEYLDLSTKKEALRQQQDDLLIQHKEAPNTPPPTKRLTNWPAPDRRRTTPSSRTSKKPRWNGNTWSNWNSST